MTDFTVYRTPQAEPSEEQGLEGRSKALLYRLLGISQRRVQIRMNELPGSGFAKELWIRLGQAQGRALELGRKGLWAQALSQFENEYRALLSAQASEEPEVLLRTIQGVQDCSCQAPEDRARADFVGLLQRSVDAARTGDNREARAMLARGKDAFHKLGPLDQAWGEGALLSARKVLQENVARSDSLVSRPSVRVGICDVTSTAGTSLKSDQDKIVSDGNSIKSSGFDPFSTGYQEALSPLLERTGFNMRIMNQALARGQIGQDEFDELRSRNQAIQKWLGRKSNTAWDESQNFRTAVTAGGGVVNALKKKLGMKTDEQSGSDVQATNRVTKVLDDTGRCLKTFLGGGTVKELWNCLPAVVQTAAKVVGVVGVGVSAYGVYRVVRS